MKGKTSDKARLQHILVAINEIENYTSKITLDDSQNHPKRSLHQ
jgi:uncharacterized protein with HEPN domain